MNGGYDQGYRSCPCFWGREPGSLIKQLLLVQNVYAKRVLDLGCGEGKNAAALASAGAIVTAVDCSESALANGRQAFTDATISWILADAVDFPTTARDYDLVLMYGLPHCLLDRERIAKLLTRAMAATAVGGHHILVAFNNRSQDLHYAHPGFLPTLLSHQDYEAFYSHHELLTSSDSILRETHPHNGIPHHHSLTRILARIR